MTEKKNSRIHLELDLDELCSGDNWGTTVGELIREELKAEIRLQIKKGIKEDPQLKRAVKKLQQEAAKKVLDALA